MSLILVRFLAALRFLTILPLPWFADKDSEAFHGAVVFFVPVGMVIGIGGYLLAVIGAAFLPHSLLACLVVVYLGAISSFLHLDGLADSADGLLSSRPRERKLEIMRDSHTGAMGVIILVLVLLIKVVALQSISEHYIAGFVLFLPIAGRCAIVLSMSALPYARSEGGLGNLFYAGIGWKIAVSALAITAITGILIKGFPFWPVMIALVTTTFLFGLWCRNSLGGMTGDTLGAVCEITETAVAVVCAAAL